VNKQSNHSSNIHHRPEEIRETTSANNKNVNQEEEEDQTEGGGGDDYDYDASWGEVWKACCTHSISEWRTIGVAVVAVMCLMYFFLLGLELLASGAKVMSGCKAGALFGDDTNPIAGLMIGILSTVLLQSSSTTTSIIVSLVGSTVNPQQGIYMVMGANIGTSLTNTIVAMGQMSDGDQLERAFAGATVHDMFNFLSVAILLPVEVVTGFLRHLTEAMTEHVNVRDETDSWEGPIRRILTPLGHRIIYSNHDVPNLLATGNVTSCDDFYPLNCDPGIDPPTYDSCHGQFGLIACDPKTKHCPAFFQADADSHEDKVSGGVVFFIGIIIIFACLLGIVSILQSMMFHMSTHIIYKATDVNGYVSIAIGAGITMVVQSSSITTSTLTPLVGIGALRLEQMYPLTLGANVGTTLTGILAALVSDNVHSLQVALAHLMFNIVGILIFYPLPVMRTLPLTLARKLGAMTRLWRGFPVVYILVMFIAMPLFFLGLSALFERDSKGFRVLGSFITVIVALLLAYWTYWCRYMGGIDACADCFKTRERRRVTLRDLPDNMEYVMATLQALVEHTALPLSDESDDEEESEEEATKTGTLERGFTVYITKEAEL